MIRRTREKALCLCNNVDQWPGPSPTSSSSLPSPPRSCCSPYTHDTTTVTFTPPHQNILTRNNCFALVSLSKLTVPSFLYSYLLLSTSSMSASFLLSSYFTSFLSTTSMNNIYTVCSNRMKANNNMEQKMMFFLPMTLLTKTRPSSSPPPSPPPLGHGNKLGDDVQHPLAVWTLLQCLILIGGQKNNAIFVIHPFYSKRLNRFVPSLWLVNDLIQPSQADPCLILILLWLCWFKRISFIEDNLNEETLHLTPGYPFQSSSSWQKAVFHPLKMWKILPEKSILTKICKYFLESTIRWWQIGNDFWNRGRITHEAIKAAYNIFEHCPILEH